MTATRSLAARLRLGGVWRSPAYVRIWSAAVISRLGSSVTALALPLLAALTLQASPTQMGLLTAAETVPVLLFGLAIGVWVDRRAKRPVMIVTDVGRALLLLAVPVAAWQGFLSIELLLVVALLVGLLSVFFEVASQAFLPVLLTPDELGEGNARLYMSWGLADVAGPGLAGWLTAALSAPIAIVIDAVSYLLSAALLGGIGTEERRESGRREAGGREAALWAGVGRRVALRSEARRFCGPRRRPPGWPTSSMGRGSR